MGPGEDIHGSRFPGILPSMKTCAMAAVCASSYAHLARYSQLRTAKSGSPTLSPAWWDALHVPTSAGQALSSSRLDLFWMPTPISLQAAGDVPSHRTEDCVHYEHRD